MRGERRTLLGWLESFPVNMLNERVNLGLTYAWTLFMANQLDRAEQYLNQLSPIVQATPAWLGELFVIRVQIAASRYDMPAVIDLAQQALTLLPPAEVSRGSATAATLGWRRCAKRVIHRLSRSVLPLAVRTTDRAP